jgi:hypothetical protein
VAEPSWIVHLLGHPAAGKRTVGAALVAASERPQLRRFVLIDNHLSSNPILAVLDGDGSGQLGPEVWDLVAEVREVVDRAILELAPPDRSFVFTNSVMVDDVSGLRSLERVRRLADARNSTYVPVALRCEREELLRRVPSEDRRRHGKWLVPSEVAAQLDAHRAYEPDDRLLLRLDTTSATPQQSAAAILGHLSTIAASH